MMNMLMKLIFPPPPKFHGVMGIYEYVDDATAAVHALRQAGHKHLQVFSPIPHHEIEAALEQGPSLIRWITFSGGVLGFTGGMALCFYTVTSWPLVVGGKELISVPAFMIVTYESMILLAGLSTLLGMLALARLPEVRAVAPYDPRFQEDRIGLWVACSGETQEKVREMMRGQGAEEVQVHV
ncbi:MAG: DUF3341 domain-containing protein [Candidatus Eisenbacteria bacterium]|uniref:DUF3341 domain-containing protein n=1 Tax=Eiseniibacteriota bacterium TaxID=2212470 RepID=A0A849SDH7_UNCEI|nr:DUF3341 domain-containing protein [Candidatus Eisenbacteria bacterium]